VPFFHFWRVDYLPAPPLCILLPDAPFCIVPFCILSFCIAPPDPFMPLLPIDPAFGGRLLKKEKECRCSRRMTWLVR
jgi:hypothetical protein